LACEGVGVDQGGWLFTVYLSAFFFLLLLVRLDIAADMDLSFFVDLIVV